MFCQNIVFPSILHNNKIDEIQINFLNSTTGNMIPMVALAKCNDDSKDKVFWCFSSADERDKLVSALSSSKNQLQEMNIRLKELATTDELTGTYNRRELTVRMHVIRRQIERRQSCLSVFMLDLDHFKQVNDTFGHGEGDRILKEFGSILMKNARIDDAVARYGGEEFVIVMPDVSSEAAKPAAERIHNAIKKIKTGYGAITVSIGVCSIEYGTNVTENEIFETADKMLYQSKTSGRNTTSFQSLPLSKLNSLKHSTPTQ